MSANCGCGGRYLPGDGEAADVWREGRVAAARKEHACIECQRPIRRGERFCFASGLADGEWFTLRRCATCATIAELVALKLDACPQWGDLINTAVEDAGLDFWSLYGSPAPSEGADG